MKGLNLFVTEEANLSKLDDSLIFNLIKAKAQLFF
jgi:hypothetical protein